MSQSYSFPSMEMDGKQNYMKTRFIQMKNQVQPMMAPPAFKYSIPKNNDRIIMVPPIGSLDIDKSKTDDENGQRIYLRLNISI